MPFRHDRNAPTFDLSNPRSLHRYFEDLETLLHRAQVVNPIEQKHYACMYVSIDTADIWEQLPEYCDPSQTLATFKKAVLQLYPGADLDRIWTRSSLSELIDHTAKAGITSLQDWASFYHIYLATSQCLIAK